MTLKLRDYQEVPVLTTINSILSFKKTVLVGCPGSGKTEMAIYIIKNLIESGKVDKVLVLAHSTNVIKDNFKSRFDSYNFDFSSQVDIMIPQNVKSTDGYDFVIVDEAHENYLADRVQKICKNVSKLLLLTGTPSKLIFKGGFNFITIAMANIPRQYFAKTGVELVSSKYAGTSTDYNQDLNLKSSVYINKTDTRDDVEKLVECLIDRLKNSNLTPDQYNNGGLFSKKTLNIFLPKVLNKTMFVCNRTKQAEWVKQKLVEMGIKAECSHSENDADSDLFNLFKEGLIDVLVVVNRGRLGYSDDNLYNIVDMSFTRNPDLIYQMFARCVRGTQDQQKFYIKLSPNGNGMSDLTAVSVQMALSLMFEDVLSKFNGKNFKTMQVIIKKSRTSKPSGIKRTKKSSVVVSFPEYTNDVVAQLIDVKCNMSDELSIYKYAEVGEVISMVTGQSLPKGYWTEERMLEYAGGFETSVDLCSANRVVYQKMRDSDMLSDVYPDYVNTGVIKQVTLDMVIDKLESEHFDSLKDFSIKYPAWYNKIKDSDEVKDKYFPGRRRSSPKGTWTNEKCEEAAKECVSLGLTRHGFEKKYKTAYVKLKGRLGEFFS